MRFNKFAICLAVLMMLLAGSAYAAMAVPSMGDKKFDLTNYHDVGNIWLRVSNYGFFGSGSDAVPPWPSLEYPGGKGIDYLFQGALWFGAKKQRRDDFGRKLYWKVYPPTATEQTVLHSAHPDWNENMVAVIDTLVTVGFDGDLSLYEFLPAYNPIIGSKSDLAHFYDVHNQYDQMMKMSTRTQQRGIDDDGDGLIDEDGPGFTFPFRWRPGEMPEEFDSFSGRFLHEILPHEFAILDDPAMLEIWFPIGFMDLSYNLLPAYNFAEPYDDDGDGRIDEDGAPVSEQDLIAYYYDYCPFGTSDMRHWGGSKSRNKHYPLNIRVRQLSYQWSYDFIKNLVYIEFNITNMNPEDELLDCAMGIYMDCDVGPQTWDSEKARDDVSGYVSGEGYEFAYTRDEDGDGGLTTGIVGARVCTPDPEQLKFDCWYWKVGEGPDDFAPRQIITGSSGKKTANEKYWLLTGRNPNNVKFHELRHTGDITEFEQSSANDTRFLFAFYGAQPGTADYEDEDKKWNLKPGHTMKIVIAVFPGENLEDLKSSARWAKEVYGQAQTLTTVVLPDIYPHYNPPEPPTIPALYVDMLDDGSRIDTYWDNRSEFTYDVKTVSTAVIGWRNPNPPDSLGPDPLLGLVDSCTTLYPPSLMDAMEMPEQFRWDNGNTVWNANAVVNPWTGHRLRHDFQGYTIWGRSGSGSQEDWELIQRWDKVDTQQDLDDYKVNEGVESIFVDYGGYRGEDTGLPNPSDHPNPEYRGWQKSEEYSKFYKLNDCYDYIPVGETDTFHGWPLYNPEMDWTPEVQQMADNIEINNHMLSDDEIQTLQARLFIHPELESRPEIFDELFERRLIPLQKFAFAINTVPDADVQATLKKERLARRYYKASIMYPRKGVEYYIAATAYDRGMPSHKLDYLETGRDASANMKVVFPGSLARENMDKIMVVPNPYMGHSSFDGRRENDEKGDKSRRLWFINLPERCTIRIYTLAGDLIQTLDHEGATNTDILTVSKAATQGVAASGIHSWDLLTRNNQITAPGVYLFSVENKADKKLKVGKFVIIK
ncbi:MAG: hypothetical protein LHW60_08095 [Candidatus Cloacimonetes bacterium]|nr:hypothetical protein [Candidatus Cloacimonadota bacterium]